MQNINKLFNEASKNIISPEKVDTHEIYSLSRKNVPTIECSEIKPLNMFNEGSSFMIPKQKETISTNITDKNFSSFNLYKLLVKTFNFGRFQNTLYVYNEETGYYHPVLPGEGIGSFGGFIRRMIPDKLLSKISTYFIAETYHWMISGTEQIIDLPKFDTPFRIAFLNGTLDLQLGILHPHDYRNYLKTGLPFEYHCYHKGDIKQTNFWHYITRLANYEKSTIDALRFMIGLALSNIRNLKTAFFIVGDSNNGKSVLAQFLIELVGHENICTLPISKLGERFSAAEVFNKKILLSSDETNLNWNANTAAIFKLLVARDRITAEFKYQQPFQFQPNALVIAFSNELPKYNSDIDAGGAISRRIFIILTGPSISVEDEDPYMLEKILNEKELVASWAIHRVIDFIKNNNLPNQQYQSSPDDTPTNSLSIYRNWVKKYIFEDSTNTITSQALYQNYTLYCNEENIDCKLIMREKTFFMRFAKDFSQFKEKFLTEDGHQVNGYRGLNLYNTQTTFF